MERSPTPRMAHLYPWARRILILAVCSWLALSLAMAGPIAQPPARLAASSTSQAYIAPGTPWAGGIGAGTWTTAWSQAAATGTAPAVAALPDGQVVEAMQDAAGDLWVATGPGGQDWGLGMAQGTSPAITSLPQGGFEIALQANTGQLWTVGSGPGSIDQDWGLPMTPGTSPAITAMAQGGFEVAFQANTGLWTVGTGPGSVDQDWSLPVAQGTSPAIAALSQGGFEVAWQSSTGTLWTAGMGPDAQDQAWQSHMAQGTSPAITSLPQGGFEVAWQSSTGSLQTVGAGPGSSNLNWDLGMAQGTSPAITAVQGGLEIAFQANTGQLWTVGATDFTWNIAAASSTSPALAPLPQGGFEVSVINAGSPAATTMVPQQVQGWPQSLLDAPTVWAASACAPQYPMCVVVGSGYALTVTSSAATLPTLIDAGNRLNAVSCSSQSFCMAVDSAGLSFVFNGGTWEPAGTVSPNIGIYGATAVSCNASDDCVANDGNGQLSVYVDGTWEPDGSGDLPPPAIQGLPDNPAAHLQTDACNAIGWCVAAGYHVYVSSNGGYNFSELSGSAYQMPPYVQVGCASPTMCLAVGGGQYSAWNGSSFSAQAAIGPLQQDGVYDGGDQISCPNSTQCEVVDAAGTAAVYLGQGNWWGPFATPRVPGALVTALSCVGNAWCAISYGNGTVVFGQLGMGMSQLSVGTTINTVACFAPGSCYLGLTNGDVATLNNGAISYTALPGANDELGVSAIACASAEFCVAGAWDGQGYVNNGLGWVPTGSLTPFAFSSASCTNVGTPTCAMLDWAGGTHYIALGGSWSAQSRALTGPNLDEGLGLAAPSIALVGSTMGQVDLLQT